MSATPPRIRKRRIFQSGGEVTQMPIRRRLLVCCICRESAAKFGGAVAAARAKPSGSVANRDLVRICASVLAAKLPLLPTVVSPCSPLFCASIRIEAPIRRDTLLYDCGKSIVDLPATDLAAGNEPTLAYWLVISRSSAIALRAIAISFVSSISRGKAPGAF